MTDPRDEVEFLLEVHDGDDRCGCLAQAVRDALDGEYPQVINVLRNCIAEHPAGITFRAEAVGEERPLGC